MAQVYAVFSCERTSQDDRDMSVMLFDPRFNRTSSLSNVHLLISYLTEQKQAPNTNMMPPAGSQNGPSLVLFQSLNTTPAHL
jgi:hypothetical protein